ncbi:MAG: SDR family oxidoreductase [Paucimonas sp.]|jgi:NAD(P)-dependent dehydrogenase (short-subunit alcohol dehydrogenase family)|nr:SDR family oxidoreductase [Paucimonas sp.]
MPTTVITGSASGIGAAVASALSAAGHRIIGIDRGNADISADLSTPEGRESAIAQALQLSGGVLDGLVCCAGVGVTAPSCGLIVAINHFGVSQLLAGLEDALGKGHNPAALVIGSVAAIRPGAENEAMTQAMLANDEARARDLADTLGEPQVAYACSKYAITHHARRLASAWGAKGIRLNVVAPGAVETPLHDASRNDPRFGQAVRDFVAPLGRNGHPEEIAALIAFLQSEQAGFIHGGVMYIDGGMDAMVRPQRV